MMDNNQNQNDPGNIGNPKDIGAFYMNRPQPLHQPRERRRFSPGMAAVVILAVFGAVIWYAYPRGSERYEGTDVPVITAGTEPYKLQPTEPGGMVVPHQDSTVFTPLEGAGAATATPEQIMPEPEEPIERGQGVETGTDEGMNAVQRDASAAEPSAVPALNLSQIETAPKTTEVLAAAPAVAEVVKPVVEEVVKPVVVAEKVRVPEKKAVVAAVTKKPAVASPTAKAAAAVAPASGKTVYIQLGSFKDEQAANKAWTLLKKQYLTVIGSLEPRIEKADLGAKGVFWRLQAGAVSEAEGGKICADLKAKGAGACIISKR